MGYKFTFEDGSESLMHYGVLGMKWGQRKAESRARIERAHRSDTSTNDYVIKKGQNAQRLTYTTGKGTEWYDHRPYEERIADIKEHGDGTFKNPGYNTDGVTRTYVSLNEADNEAYRKSYQPNSAVLNMQLTAVSDIKIAGGKKVVEEIMRFEGDNKLADKLSSAKIDNARDLHKWLSKNTNGGEYYDLTDPSMGGAYTNAVVKSLRKQGYSGMKDLWDGMTYARVSEANVSKGKRETKKLLQELADNPRDPTIVFEPEKNFKITDVTLLRNDKGKRLDK